MDRDFQTFVGVDLGGGKGKNTAVARLERISDGGVRVVFVDVKDTSGQFFYDAVLVELLLGLPPHTLLAIDAPLLPSVCMRCRLPSCAGVSECSDPVVDWFRRNGPVDGVRGGKPAVTTYTQRACEIVLARKHGILPRETLGQGMGPLTARAHYLRRALEHRYELNRNLLEVYPKASVHALFGALAARRYKRHADTWRTRAQMLERLADGLRFEVWREGCLVNDHCFDAVICAYTGFLWATQSWQLPEQDRAVFEQDGWIWFPPIPGEP